MFVRAVFPAALAAVVLLSGAVGARASITLGQLDTFQDGLQAAWGGGSGPMVVNDGGPTGAGDRYLRQSADGSGSGGKLSMYNHDQWLGNYITAGVTGIEMDLFNFSTQALKVRIAFKTSGGQSSPGFSHAAGFSLPNDGQWHHAIFFLRASDFATIGAPGSFNDCLSTNALEFRILHATSPILTGTPVVGAWGVDNVHAIPGPHVLTALVAAGGASRCRRRR